MFQFYHKRELKEYIYSRALNIIGVVLRGIHITGMSRVSILDKFPVAGIISDDVPTPRKYPARMVDAVTSDVRAAGVTTSATTTDPSRGLCNRRTTEGRGIY